MKKLLVSLLSASMCLSMTVNMIHAEDEINDDELLVDETNRNDDQSGDEGITPLSLNGWYTNEDNETFYYIDDEFTTSWAEIDGSTYYFDENGIMQTGFVTVDGSLYYFSEEGVLVKGFFCVDDGTYYGNLETGALAKRWTVIDGSKYYFNSTTGKMKVNCWYTTNGKTYFLDANGVVQTGIFSDGINLYYANEKGVKQSNCWVTVGNKKYYCTEDGSLKIGWMTLDKKKYYFNENGVMKRGSTFVVNGNRYYAKSDGTIFKGWKTFTNGTRFFNYKYQMVVGWYTVSNKQYYFDENGYRVTGWLTLDGKKYHFASDGIMDTGFKKIGSKKYYFSSTGVMFKNGWKTIGNYKYYFLNSGAMAVNREIDGKWVGPDGKYMPNYVKGILVVNKKHGLSSSYAPGEDPTAGAQARKLIRDMQSQGYAVSSSYSGYRSYATQRGLYNNYVASYGQAQADTFSARPGYSEHQTGLAFDLIGSGGGLLTTPRETNWVAKNAHKYGFIVRYQPGKEAITGYVAEPWHIRYVGSEATAIYQSGLTLEEYLGVSGGDYK